MNIVLYLWEDKRYFNQSLLVSSVVLGGGSSAAANAQIEDLTNQLMESKLTIEGLEKERDFYFSKLRDIEVLAQEHENDGGEFVQRALQVWMKIAWEKLSIKLSI